MKPTPKSLTEAVQNALDEHKSCASYGASDVRWHLIDYLAQKFVVAIAKATSEEERGRLKQLFDELKR